MKEASKLFAGMHDFKAFSERSPEDKSTKCLVESIEVTEDVMKIYIRIRASHFLWKMVRRIVGSLVEIGRGNMTIKGISDLINTPPVRGLAAGRVAEFTAPPSGLFLEKVEY